MPKYIAPGFISGKILLPDKKYDLAKWSVIACDQFTSNPKYWNDVAETAGSSPSALNITLPEIYLSDSEERTKKMLSSMRDYAENVLVPAVEDGFVFVKRTTTTGVRMGLVGLIDLEKYSYQPDSKTLVRPTEKTIPERVPPRARVRKDALIEIPHVMMLIDDIDNTVIEPLDPAEKECLYDIDLMAEGGHIEGYKIDGINAENVVKALNELHKNCKGLLYAVGDGNHSLAAAKACYEANKNELTRYAMVELVNIHSPALVFEPIHRIIKSAESDLADKFKAFLDENGIKYTDGDDVRFIYGDRETGFGFKSYPLKHVQDFVNTFDDVDYIHGETDVRELVNTGNCTGILLKSVSKSELLPYVRENGVLPRKAFSMGEARDKRYYMECRTIK